MVSLDDVELFRDDGVGADQVVHVAEVGQFGADAHEAEAIGRGTRNPVRAFRQKWKVFLQLLERRLRIEEVPDDDAGDQNGPRGS